MTLFKIIIDLVIAACAIIAIFTAFNSNRLAKEAQKTANEAIQQAKKQFLEQNRPYIVIEPIFDKQTNSYFNITENEFEFLITLNYKVSNVGSAIARNFRTPPQTTYNINNQEAESIGSDLKEPVSIAPGQSFVTSLWMAFKILDGEMAKKFIMDLESGKGSLSHAFPAMYQNDNDTRLTYRMLVEHRISKDKAEILKSEMTRVPI